jgi:hypothetical protein
MQTSSDTNKTECLTFKQFLDKRKAMPGRELTVEDFNFREASVPEVLVQPIAKIDISIAEQFLKLLDPSVTKFTFQTFDDNEQRKKANKAAALEQRKKGNKKAKEDPFAEVKSGTLAQRLSWLETNNDQGAGVFVTINKTDLKGRKIDNVTETRAVFVELDNQPLEPVLNDPDFFKPHIVVKSSPGDHWHIYWRVEGLGLKEFAAVQKALIARFNGDPAINDLPRVMRLPGFLHRKRDPFQVKIVNSMDAPPIDIKELMAKLDMDKPSAKTKSKKKSNPFVDVSGDDEHESQWNILCTEALANLSKWVPKLIPDAKLSKGIYRISSAALGRDLQEDLSISPEGIKDWGVHDIGDANEGKRTCIDLVMMFGKMEFKEATDWLHTQLGHDPSQRGNPVVVEMNKRHAAVSIHGKYRILTWLPHFMYPKQQIAEFSSKNDFCNLHVHPKVKWTVEEDGERKTVKVDRGKYYLSQPEHQRFDGIDFNPGAPLIITRTDSSGRITRYANMYSGFSIEPCPGDCSLYLGHIFENICGGDARLNQYILDWMAWGVQRPDDISGTALSLRGKPGTGKGVFVQQYGKIFGRHFVHLTNSEQLTAKFNSMTAHALLIFADEVMFAGDHRTARLLKTMITEKTKKLEYKNIDATEFPNYSRTIFATNDDHPLPIEFDDRRYCSVYVEPHRRQDRAYFGKVAEQMENGGRAALLDMLLKRDLSNFNPEDIPQNDELRKQKLDSAPVGDAIIIGFAQDGCLPGALVDTATHKKDRPWIARARGPGCLFDEMKRQGGRDTNFMNEMQLTDILKKWGFRRHHLGDATGWAAPGLTVLRNKLSEKYPAIKWDNPDLTEWGAPDPAESAEQVDDNPYTDAAKTAEAKASNVHPFNKR